MYLVFLALSIFFSALVASKHKDTNEGESEAVAKSVFYSGFAVVSWGVLGGIHLIVVSQLRFLCLVYFFVCIGFFLYAVALAALAMHDKKFRIVPEEA